VLQQQSNVFNSQIQLNNSTTQAEMAVVTLYKALGGGWDNSLMQAHDGAISVAALGEAK
jgi:outer membrane protein TolC